MKNVVTIDITARAGCGKSTIAAIISNALAAQGIECTIDGEDEHPLPDVTTPEFAQRILSLQERVVVNLTSRQQGRI